MIKDPTKREKAIKKLEDDLTSDELIGAVKVLHDMAKQLTMATGKLDRLHKKKNETDMTLPELLDEMNFTKSRTTMYIGDVFSSDIERDFIIAALIKEKKIKRCGNYMFNGKTLKKPSSYGEERNFQIHDVFHDIKVSTIRVTVGEIDFLVLPAYQKKSAYQINYLPGVWIIAPSEKSVSVIYRYLKEIASKYSPLRNQFIVVDASGHDSISYSVKRLEAKFSLDDIVLPDEISSECKLLTTMVENFEAYADDKVPFRRNIMFAGTPGTGKTTAVTAVAQAVLEAKGTIIYVRSANFSRAYDLAARLAPALVIIEDFDLLAPDREQYGTNPVTATALNVLDGLLSKEGVLTLVTTNLLDHVDAAAKRAGRVDRGYEFKYPTKDMKLQLVDIHLRHYDIQILSSDVYDAIRSVLDKDDVTGAMIESITRNAKQQAIAAMTKDVTIEHVQAAAGCVGVRSSKTASIGFDQK